MLFFLHFLLSLHDYEVKMPNFKFYVGRKQATLKFFLKRRFRCRRRRLVSNRHFIVTTLLLIKLSL